MEYYLLKEDGDKLLKEDGYGLLLDLVIITSWPLIIRLRDKSMVARLRDKSIALGMQRGDGWNN